MPPRQPRLILKQYLSNRDLLSKIRCIAIPLDVLDNQERFMAEFEQFERLELLAIITEKEVTKWGWGGGSAKKQGLRFEALENTYEPLPNSGVPGTFACFRFDWQRLMARGKDRVVSPIAFVKQWLSLDLVERGRAARLDAHPEAGRVVEHQFGGSLQFRFGRSSDELHEPTTCAWLISIA